MFDVNKAQVQDVPDETNPHPESPAENKGEDVEEPSQGGEESKDDNTLDADDIPFHKHPRWIAKQREIEELRTKLDGYDQIIAKGFTRNDSPNDSTPDMPDWWKDAFGEDEASQKAWTKQVAHENARLQELEEKILQKVQNTQADEAKRQADAVAKYEAEIEEKVQDLKDKGLKFNKNELLKVVEEFSVDENGQYLGRLFPFDKAYDIMMARKAKTNPTKEARKEAAELSVQDTKNSATTTDTPTVSDIRQRGWGSWRDII